MTRRVSLAVAEGFLDMVAAEKLLDALHVKGELCAFIDKRGRDAFWRDAHRYNAAAKHHGPIVGLADLEAEPCSSGLIHRHLPHGRHAGFVLRIAVRMVESWLLADRQNIVTYLSVPLTLIPLAPDTLENPKREIVNLARRSPRRDIREDIVPDVGSSGVVGPGYTTQMQLFIRDHWNPLTAQAVSASLRRAISAVRASCA